MRVVGLGLRAAANLGSLGDLFRRHDVTAALPLAIPDFRQAHPLVRDLQARGYRIRLIPQASLRGVSTPTRSPRILARHGTGSIAEACALVAAGPAARLVLPRVVSADGCVTLALARSEESPEQ